MKKIILIYSFLLLGAIMQGMAMSIFLFPHSIPSGGAAGIAILVNHWFHLPLGFSLWLANVVFLVFALKYFGYTWTFRTILAVAATSTTVTLISTTFNNIPHTHILLDIAVGSVLFGVGVGILIRTGASSGGMVIPALMIATYKNWSPGKVMMGINLLIFLLTSFVIDYKIVFFAVICQLISTNVIDLIYQLKIYSTTFLTPSWRRK
ncbi:YitT family protein [Robertmurraya sp. DFI.2.37]|uniref:YitT family protein n=1 Tax=Robertmurraya sp. DFI.2.37 TaxID=3031819 RepID=UPI0023DBA580|nr:YitT family protein [Robertmurraya sp. DFI.2.37]MDF1510078.1 YitT family protein [Robertmurraya sp. DFI.2.37]